MTALQKHQFNVMRNALKEITRYESIETLRRNSQSDWGLDYEEALEYAYENIKHTAMFAVKGVKELK